ncbi:hypothetical protein K438DRAFT_456881 [Mycena galopus ATCC 62051]|nr:hypothetical protein K438DRAFT_456881 [Mycena galopus ATCC 62051]
MESDTMDWKKNFRRCAYCHQAYYGSVDCQKIDWRSGSHRECCHTLRTVDFNEDMSAKDRSFMRALLHADIIDNHNLDHLFPSDHASRAPQPARSCPGLYS